MNPAEHEYAMLTVGYRLTHDEEALVRSLAREYVASMQRERGAPYSANHVAQTCRRIEHRLKELVADSARGAVEQVRFDLREPPAPVDALARWRSERDRHALDRERHKIGEDTPPLASPEAVRAYEIECAQLDEELRRRARANDVYWFGDPQVDELRALVAEQFPAKSASRQPRRAPRSSTRVESARLVGSPVSSTTSSGADPEGIPDTLTPDEARSLSGLPLVFVEELKVAGGSRAEFERRSESRQHREQAEKMAGALRRLGYRVYAGGVGLRGLYVMADLFGWRDGNPLFVECMTKASIEKYRRHEAKKALARRVPFCFVGQVPPSFVAACGEGVYGVQSPGAPRMIGGEWVPRHYRRGHGFTGEFLGVARKGPSVLHVEVTMPGLALIEDTSGFLAAAMADAFAGEGRAAMAAAGWSIVSPVWLYRSIPFRAHGKSQTAWQIEGHGGVMKVLLGQVPPRIELRGSEAPLRFVKERLTHVGLALVVSATA